jgi:capsular exopolysaccharide synthesis family protein
MKIKDCDMDMEIDDFPVEQGEEGLDIRYYISLLLQWWWLILLAGLLAGAASYFISNRMTPYYQSSTTVLVNASPASKTTDYNSVLVSEQLTSTYSQIMAKDPVLRQVAYQVGLSNTPEDLKKWITVTPIRDTQLIQLTVETTDPVLSAKIANTIVSVFSAQNQDIQTQRFAQSKVSIEAQLADTEDQISTFSIQADRATLAEEKDRLDTKVAQYRTIYSNLLLSYEQLRLSEAQSISTIVQVEPAVPNVTPVKPKVVQNTILAVVVGFLLAAGAIIAREAMDDTINTPDDVSRKFKLPVLGVIIHHISEPGSPITLTDPRSPTAEAYRTLRTNLGYTSVDCHLHTLLVTSAEPGEGKTTTVSNLGVVMAQNGKQVIVADCDLRHPRIHTYFGLENREGLSTLMSQTTDEPGGSRQSTKIDGLSVVTSGSLPPNPSELMGSQKLQSIFKSMLKTVDMVIIDTPPTLAVTDAAALAPSMDGVLLVVRPGKTRTDALRQTIDQLHQVNARILGIVLNDVVIRGKAYGYRYKYYRNYAAYQNYYGAKTGGK